MDEKQSKIRRFELELGFNQFMMKQLPPLSALAFFLFGALPAFTQETYTVKMPPSSMTGIIHQGKWWYFDNSGDNRAKKFPNGGKYINSGRIPQRINKDVINVNGIYACRGVPFEYGKCTKTGWIKDRNQPF